MNLRFWMVIIIMTTKSFKNYFQCEKKVRKMHSDFPYPCLSLDIKVWMQECKSKYLIYPNQFLSIVNNAPDHC